MGRLIALLLAAAGIHAAPPIRALILSGRNNHDWRTTTPFLKNCLLDTGRFDARVNEEPSGMTAATLAGYDVLVLDYNGPRWGTDAEEAVAAFVGSGKGLVVVHGASYAFGDMELLGDHHARTGKFEPPWKEYAKMAGGRWSAGEPKTGHGERRVFVVRFTDPSHPVARGLGATFQAADELYHSFRLEPGISVLATAFDDGRRGGTGKDEPILWTNRYGQGRVFHTALGHDVTAMQQPGFIATFVRGTEWAATGDVLAPAPPAPRLRVLAVTGGHEYEPSFYTLFNGYDWNHVAGNNVAFKEDFRERYDVLALYDLEQEISDAARRNLQAFVEGGKGIVVLHHAIADYNAWTWWYRDVVGGRYLLKPDGGQPASTYKHDQDIVVRPAATHPVTAGLFEFPQHEETYKGMWISPEVKVLLRTGHPTSDGPVAWISPYPKSRVVYIQLGHDHQVHESAAYRTLVRNAIRWAATGR